MQQHRHTPRRHFCCLPTGFSRRRCPVPCSRPGFPIVVPTRLLSLAAAELNASHHPPHEHTEHMNAQSAWHTRLGALKSRAKQAWATLSDRTRALLRALWAACCALPNNLLFALKALSLGVGTTFVLNALILPIASVTLGPQLRTHVSNVLCRPVNFHISFVSPPGVLGWGPIATMQDLDVGQREAERSAIHIDEAVVHFRPFASVLQRRAVLDIHASGVRATVRQAENYSWFGYPDDTVPSARDFVPGLTGSHLAKPLPSSPHQAQTKPGAAAQAARDVQQDSPGGPATDAGADIVRRAAALQAGPELDRQSKALLQEARAMLHVNTDGAQRAGATLTSRAEDAAYQTSFLPTMAMPPAQAPAQAPVRGSTQGGAAVPEEAPGTAEWRKQARGGPAVALRRVTVSSGTIDAYVYGDAYPRQVRNIEAELSLGHNYGSLQLEASGDALARAPESLRCTMPTTGAPRHLRHCTPGGEAAPLEARPVTQRGPSPASLAQWHAKAESSGLPVGALPAVAPDPAPVDAVSEVPPRAGGRIHVTVSASDLAPDATAAAAYSGEAPWPQVSTVVRGEQLDAALVERIVELPMDIYGGSLDGALEIHMREEHHWTEFPAFGGRVVATGGSFHFWDAPDDFYDAALTLFFDVDRMHLINARGMYGAVPLTASGEVGLSPVTGRYNLQANVGATDVNAARATLGIRPLPYSVAGALGGHVLCYGPLEAPVFAGRIESRELPAAARALTADSDAMGALEAALASGRAAALAYDKVAAESATAVFTFNTKSAALAVPAWEAILSKGGRLHGSGVMSVDPAAEFDVSAVHFDLVGRGIAPAALLPYLPLDTPGADAMLDTLGPLTMDGYMHGSHAAPAIRVAAAAPNRGVEAVAELGRDAVRAVVRAPRAVLTAAAETRFASYEDQKAALTQEEAERLGVPELRGLGVTATLQAADLQPLLRLAQEHGGSGDAAVALAALAAEPVVLEGHVSSYVSAIDGAPAAPFAGVDSPQFAGPLRIRGLQVNGLRLAKEISGTIGLRGDRLSVSAQGAAGTERVFADVNLSAMGAAAGCPQGAEPLGIASGEHDVGPAAADVDSMPTSSTRSQEESRVGASASDWGPVMRRGEGGNPAGAASAGSDPSRATREAGVVTSAPPDGVGGEAGASEVDTQHGQGAAGSAVAKDAATTAAESSADTQCSVVEWQHGAFRLWAQADDTLQKFALSLEGLSLDDLRLARARGLIRAVSASADLDAQRGTLCVDMRAPQLRSARADSIHIEMSAENGIVRLHDTRAVQTSSSYELRGEYRLHPRQGLAGLLRGTGPPHEGARGPDGGGSKGAGGVPGKDTPGLSGPGDWRAAEGPTWWLKVASDARLEDLVPVARVFRQHPIPPPADPAEYATHLQGIVGTMAWHAADQGFSATAIGAGVGGSRGHDAAVAHGPRGGRLPSLASLRGHVVGEVVALGGANGASRVDMDLAGDDWQYAGQTMKSAVLQGSLDGEQGLNLTRLSVQADGATLTASGRLLGAEQDARLRLDALRLEVFQPLIDAALPSLSGADPGAAAAAPSQGSLSRQFSTLQAQLRRASEALRPAQHTGSGSAAAAAVPPPAIATPAPVRGLLYVDGVLTGSMEHPEGRVHMHVARGALGAVPLSEASATATLDASGRARVDAALAPAGSHGAISLTCAVDLATGSALDARCDVRDAGMRVLTELAGRPVQWVDGRAALSIRATGRVQEPTLTASAQLTRARMLMQGLRDPLVNVALDASLADDVLRVRALQATSGPTAVFRMQGQLPLHAGEQGSTGSLTMVATDIDVKAPAYTGRVGGRLTVSGALAEPTLSGEVRASSGALSLNFNMPTGGSSSAAPRTNAAPSPVAKPPPPLGESLLEGLRAASASGDAAGATLPLPPELSVLRLQGLRLFLGPDLRVSAFPWCQLALTGVVEASGTASAPALRVAGDVELGPGVINLFATQFQFDRNHRSVIAFTGEPGLNPIVDVSMASREFQINCNARLSSAGRAVTITRLSDGTTRALSGSELPAMLEQQLRELLVEDNGQLRVNAMVMNALSSVLPRIEGTGRWGEATWRVVGAPIPLAGNEARGMLIGAEAEAEMALFADRLRLVLQTRHLSDARLSATYQLAPGIRGYAGYAAPRGTVTLMVGVGDRVGGLWSV